MFISNVRQNQHRMHSSILYQYDSKVQITIQEKDEIKEEIGELRCYKKESIWRPFFCLHRVPTSFWTIFCTNDMIICVEQQYISNTWVRNEKTKTAKEYETIITAKQIVFLQMTSSHQNLNQLTR